MSAVWRRALVIGATGGIGEEIARQLARQGCAVALVARRETDLNRLSAEINSGAPAETPLARAYPHDVTCYDQVPGLFQQICREMGGMDAVIYAAGYMPRLGSGEYDFEKDRQTVEVNLLGAIAWLNEAAHRFGQAGEGAIVGISSVAGDRGRGGQPVYGASKAALSAYLESLRNRLGPLGVSVVTIKPGPVATPMTEGLGHLPLMIPAQRAAAQIIAAAQAGKRTAYVPLAWRPIMALIRAIPSPVFRRMKKLNS
jgi:decaprenylphospho-beta-D-erythro-pentofuranosid-2-ulose 2-reductase